MKDYLSYRMMAEFGADAPLCSYVWVTVNGEDWGLFLACESIEESFMERVYNGEGDLYKPDSLSMGGGGPGNGRDFNMDDFMEKFSESDEEGDSGDTNDQADSVSGAKFNSGTAAAITSYAKDPDAAWEALKTIIDQDEDTYRSDIPILRSSFDKMCEEYYTYRFEFYYDGSAGWGTYDPDNPDDQLTTEDLERPGIVTFFTKEDAERITRESPAIFDIPRAMMILSSLAPKEATIAIARTIRGTHAMISITRMIRSSAIPPR